MKIIIINNIIEWMNVKINRMIDKTKKAVRFIMINLTAFMDFYRSRMLLIPKSPSKINP